MNRYFFQALITLFSLASCTIATKEEQVSPKVLATEYQNNQDYGKAIEILEDYCPKNPGDDECKIFLASAYAGKSRVDIIQNFEIYRGLIFEEEKERLKPQSSPSEVPLDGEEEENNIFKQLQQNGVYAFLSSLNEAYKLLIGVPNLQTEEQRRIITATNLLASIETDSRYYKRAIFYSSFLNLILFLNGAKILFPGLSQTNFSDINFVCTFDFSNLFDVLDKSYFFLNRAVEDLNRVHEVTGEEMSSGLKKLRETTYKLRSNFDKIGEEKNQFRSLKAQYFFCG